MGVGFILQKTSDSCAWIIVLQACGTADLQILQLFFMILLNILFALLQLKNPTSWL